MKTIAITGVLGYSGRYIAAEAVQRGWRVIGLTHSAGRLPNPAGYELRPFPWEEADSLQGADALANTYWVRFSHKGGGHAAFSHGQAIRNTKQLFLAAKKAGVRRIIHTSITNPDAASPLPYFRGKAELEAALAATGIPHSILRPAILFGETPAESILINNMAWCLRRLPCVGTFGKGEYRLQPIHVRDFAALALDEAEREESERILNATGPETYSFRGLWSMLAQAIGCRRPILPVPACIGYAAARALGLLVHDVVLTKDEIAGLSEGRLAVDTQPIGKTSLQEWAQRHAATLGLDYQSELARRQ